MPKREHKPPLVPDTLTVIMADTMVTYVSLVHENEHRPYGRRTVQIELTEEQRRALAPRVTGSDGGTPTHEVPLDSWLEPASRPLTED